LVSTAVLVKHFVIRKTDAQADRILVPVAANQVIEDRQVFTCFKSCAGKQSFFQNSNQVLHSCEVNQKFDLSRGTESLNPYLMLQIIQS